VKLPGPFATVNALISSGYVFEEPSNSCRAGIRGRKFAGPEDMKYSATSVPFSSRRAILNCTEEVLMAIIIRVLLKQPFKELRDSLNP
jgi:hypothetical protein